MLFASAMRVSTVPVVRRRPKAVPSEVIQQPIQPSSEKRLLCVRDAAAYLSCSVWSVRDLISRGVIPHIQIGKRYLIDRVDLDRWIDGVKAALPGRAA